MWDENTYSTGNFVPQVPHFVETCAEARTWGHDRDLPGWTAEASGVGCRSNAWDENTYSTGNFVPQVPHWWGTGSVPISL